MEIVPRRFNYIELKNNVTDLECMIWSNECRPWANNGDFDVNLIQIWWKVTIRSTMHDILVIKSYFYRMHCNI